MALAGGFEFDDGMIGHVPGANITPDRETGIGDWSPDRQGAAMAICDGIDAAYQRLCLTASRIKAIAARASR
jgi:hypothetical protein